MAKRKAAEQSLIPRDDDTEDDLDERTPSPVKRRRLADEQRITKVNDLTLEDFKKRYINPKLLHYRKQNHDDRRDFHVDSKSVDTISKIELETCFKLIELTSRPDYEASSWGWHPKRKKREMKEDDMRYLLVRSAGDDQNTVLGFLSFMLTHDSTPSVPVLYVYEIHLSQALRSCGLGAHLMNLAESIAANIEVEKVMLTCFMSNKNAHSFYAKRGYEADVCSPEDRTTRNKVIKPDYVIMSKVVQGSPVRSAANGGEHDDVREGLQTRVERVATDNAPIDITERRPALRYREATNISGKALSNQIAADNGSRIGWKSVFSRMFAFSDQENFHAQNH